MNSSFIAILRHELNLVRRVPVVIVITLVMPIIVMSILRSTVRASLRQQGFVDATGAEQVVPGQALLFGFFLTAAIGLSFFREHGWNTWDRLRTSPASLPSIVVAKCLPWSLLGVVQLVVLFTVGAIFFDLDLPDGSGILGMALISVCWVLVVSAFGVAMVAMISSIQVINSAANLGALLFASIGGAIVASDDLPGWASAVGPAVPTHWAMTGYQRMLIDGDTWTATVVPCLVLVGFAVLFGAIAVWRLDSSDEKMFWT